MPKTEKMSERTKIETLLPWYVTGKLNAADHEIVEQYLSAHPDMEMQLDLIKQECFETTLINQAIPTPPASNIDLLMEKLDEEFNIENVSPKASWLHSLWSDFAKALKFPVVQFAGVAASVLIIFQAVSIGVLLNTTSQNGIYTTASGSSETATQGVARQGIATQGVVLLVALNQSATTGEISKFLQESKGLIVSGPIAGGFYHIKFATKSGKPADVKRFAKSLVTTLETRKDLFGFISELE